jgi:ankyrin repeat protein
VVIVGAGVTLNATADESGRPLPRITWQGLIRNGLDYLVSDDHVDASNPRIKRAYGALNDADTDCLLDAANILSNQLTRVRQFPTWLDTVFGSLHTQVRHPAILDALKTLHGKGATLLTTNYDDLLERHCGLRRVGRSNRDDVLKFMRGDIDGVFHIHGSYQDPHEIVLDTMGYYEVRHSNEVQNILRFALGYKTILFVGCGSGLEDPNFEAILKWVSAEQETLPNRHCLLVRNNDKLDYKPLVRIKYGPSYGDLSAFLNELSDTSVGVPRLSPQSAVEAHERDNDGFTALDRAVLKGDVEEIQTQWEQGADLNAIEPRRGYTPLIESIYRDQHHAFNALIAFGADVNKPNSDQHSPLHFCLNQRKDFFFGFTLINEPGIDLNGRDKNDRTPLMFAVLSPSLPFTDMILSGGADVNANDENGVTAMHFAAIVRSEEIMGRLLKGGADIDAQNKRGQTPLHFAVNSSAIESLNWLLKNGANVNIADENNRTPLQVAKVKNTEACVRQLEEHANLAPNDGGTENVQTALAGLRIEDASDDEDGFEEFGGTSLGETG